MSLSKRAANPLPIRFWAKVNKDGLEHPQYGKCWLWTASTFVNGIGYGQVTINRRTTVAHRVSWQLCVGEIPEGKLVLHKCDVPLCVNPDHLFLGTHLDNVRDMWEKGREVVIRGEDHPSSTLTEIEVLEIRRLHARGRGGYKALAKKFKVTPMTIARAVRRESWVHI